MFLKHSKSGPGGKAQITWDNPRELEAYIQKLQAAAERLSTENRKLRKWHTNFIEKVYFPDEVEILLWHTVTFLSFTWWWVCLLFLKILLTGHIAYEYWSTSPAAALERGASGAQNWFCQPRVTGRVWFSYCKLNIWLLNSNQDLRLKHSMIELILIMELLAVLGKHLYPS